MAQAATVRLHGLREVNRAFKRIEGDVAGELKDKLLKLGRPIAEEGASRISHYPGAVTSTIAPRALMKSVFVTQRQRKRTGLRPDFGALQMRHLLGALYDHEDEIYEGVDDLLNWLARKEGF